jgi:hypothetical protein
MRTLILSWLACTALAYKSPAPAYRVHPDPTEYLDWLPNHPGHGNFQHRNHSVSPWRPRPHHPPHYPRPGQCEAQHPGPPHSFWLSDFHGVEQGTSPFAVNGSGYRVFRNVKDFGARGDGLQDDTQAFNDAISSIAPKPSANRKCLRRADRCAGGGRVSGGLGPLGTTGQPALIYVGTSSPTGIFQPHTDKAILTTGRSRPAHT